MRVIVLVLAAAACDAAVDDVCGPAQGVVARVIDGDTIELQGGERVRYLLVDAPERDACFGPEATAHNERLVAGEHVQLTYEGACTDDYDRLLAWVEVDGREVNALLVERGLARVLHIPPQGDARVEAFAAAEARARRDRIGLWGACGDRE